MSEQLYTATVTATAGRAASDDGALDLAVREPAGQQQAGQADDGSTNPEQLMAAAQASCLLQALRIAASSQSAGADKASVRAQVTLRSGDGPGYTASYRLEVTLPGLDADAAQRVVTEAKALCPFTKILTDDVLEVALGS